MPWQPLSLKKLSIGLLIALPLFLGVTLHAGAAQNSTLKSVSGDQETGTQFFLQPRNSVDFQERPGHLLLANEYVGLEFINQGKQKFILNRLYAVKFHNDFVYQGLEGPGASFWKLVLIKDLGKDKKEITLTNMDEAKPSFSFQKSGDQGQLTIMWKGLSVSAEKGVVDVAVTVTLRKADSLSRWRISVTNRSKTYGIWNVMFPVFHLVPVGGQPEANVLAIGRSRGSLVQNPFQYSIRNVYGFYAEKGSFWPGNLNMQFQALYNNTGRGLYLATHDGGGYRKIFYFAPELFQKALEYKIVHSPANMGYPHEDYHMSYDLVVGPFTGDWYDAAQIFRQWALKQQWCQAGPLNQRTDIPRWFKVAFLILKVASYRGESQFPQLQDKIIRFLNFIDTDLPIYWYGWKKYFPDKTIYNKPGSPYRVPEARPFPVANIHDGNYPSLPALPNFAATLKAISEARGHVLPYVCARIFDQGLNENAPFAKEAKPNVMRDDRGKIVLEDKRLSWGMCYHTPWWQERLKETVTALLKQEHAGGIYFDTFMGGYVRREGA